MTVQSVTARSRRAAEALMTLTLAAYEPGAKTTDADGMESPGWTPKGSTRGRIQGPSMVARDPLTRFVTVGDVQRPVIDEGLHIPVSAPVPALGWQYEVTAVGPADDPALLGRRYQVYSSPVKSLDSSRRLDIVEVS